jgi:hypothetical protein
MRFFKNSEYLTGDTLRGQWVQKYGQNHRKALSLLKKSRKNAHVVIGIANWNGENSSVEYFIKPMNERVFQRFIKSMYAKSPTLFIYAVHRK